jgi:hypothetical protein
MPALPLSYLHGINGDESPITVVDSSAAPPSANYDMVLISKKSNIMIINEEGVQSKEKCQARGAFEFRRRATSMSSVDRGRVSWVQRTALGSGSGAADLARVLRLLRWSSDWVTAAASAI